MPMLRVSRRLRSRFLVLAVVAVAGVAMASVAVAAQKPSTPEARMSALVSQGREIFRHETWGDEAFWTDTIKLDKAIEGSAFGGSGPVSARRPR